MKMNKKGSYIMEAAIVLPLIILTIITITMILMFFYSQMTERCRLHVALRQESGRITGQTNYIGDQIETDVQLYTDNKLTESTVSGKKYLIMKNKGVLNKKGTFIVEGKSYAVDGTDYIRYRNSINKVTGGESQ